MQIRWKYLLWVNGVLLVIWAVYILLGQVWERQDMLRIEARSLQDLARLVEELGFRAGAPLSGLDETVQRLARVYPGTEIMVLDRRSVVRFSSTGGRVGRRWREQDIDDVLEQRKASSWHFRDHYHAGLAMLDVTVGVPDSTGRPQYAIHVARRMDMLIDLLAEHRTRNTLWALVSVVLIGVVLSLVTYAWLIRPINRVTQVLSASRWYAPQRRGDELQRLLGTVRRMVQHAEETVREREARFSALGEIAAGLAHELRNPLHIIRGDAELLAREPGQAEVGQDILEEVDRINRFVNDLLDYTRPSTPTREPTEVRPVVEAAVETVRRTHQGLEGVTFAVRCDGEACVSVDSDHLRQVLVNLVSNGVEAMAAGGGTLAVDLEPVEPLLCIVVSDEGEGVSGEDRERLFEPFFTRRPAGTGLGLSVVRRLVDLYDGTIDVDSSPGEGTRVRVCLPRRCDAR